MRREVRFGAGLTAMTLILGQAQAFASENADLSGLQLATSAPVVASNPSARSAQEFEALVQLADDDRSTATHSFEKLVSDRLSGSVDIEFGYVRDPRGRNEDAINDLFMDVDLGLAYQIQDSLWLYGSFALDTRDENATLSVFDDPIVSIDNLYLWGQFFDGALAVFVGRRELPFEGDLGAAEGVLDRGFSADYEFDGVLALGAETSFNALGGSHQFSIAAFMADRTFLSQTYINNSTRLRLDDGGLANTNGPESFVARLAGEIDWFDYTLAQRVGEDEPSFVGDPSKDEYGSLINLGVTPIKDERLGELRLVGEAFRAINYEAEQFDALYWTAGASYDVDRFSFGLSHTQRDIQQSPVDDFSVASAEIDLGGGFFVGGEVQRLRESERVRGVFGAQVAYRAEF